MVTREFRRSRLFSTTQNLNVRELERRRFKLLVLSIESANRLNKKDIFGLSDPYVRVRFEGTDPDKLIPLTPNSTRTCKRSLAPHWNESLYFLVGVNHFSIILDIFDENILTKDDHLGRVMAHFDLMGDPDVPGAVLQPHVWDTPGWNPHRAEQREMRLRKKYERDFLQEMSGIQFPYIDELKHEFRTKLSKKQQSAGGTLKFGYSFLMPSLPETVSILRNICDISVTGDMHDDHDHPMPSIQEYPQRSDGQATSLGFEGLAANLTNQQSQSTFPAEEPPHDGWELVPRINVNVRTTSYGLEAHQEESSDEEEDNLPEGWEQRVDSNGRRIFFNHTIRRTSLRHPSARVRHVPVAQRNYLPRRNSHDVVEVETDDDDDNESVPSQGSGHSLDSISSPIPSAPVIPTLEVVEENTIQQGAAASSVGESTPITSTSTGTTLPSTGATPRSTGAMPRSTGATPTSTSPRAAPKLSPMEAKKARLREGLPQGWDVAVTPDGKTYYVDHINKKTTWDRPKMKERKPQAAESGSKSTPTEQDSDLPPGWEMRKTKDGEIYYVNHNTRTTQWEKPGSAPADLGPLPSGWEMKQMPDGKIFFIDHKTKSTQWEDPRLQAKNKPAHILKYSRDYKQKYANFCDVLGMNRTARESQRFEITVHRSKVMEDSYAQITRAPSSHLKRRFWVNFAGEHGYDYGGLAREWFQLLSHEMFNPYYGLFEYAASDDYTLQINPESGTYNENHLDYYRFIGRVCGMAIYHKKLIDAFFIRPFYRMILGRPITLKDMESVDVELYNSIKYIKDNDPEPLCLTFSVNKTVFGEIIEEELKPGGKDIAVTEENKKEYIELLIEWRFTKRVQKQMSAFRDGLSDVIPIVRLQVFDANELEYLLGGLAHIDVNDWKKNTELRGYLQTDQVIIWFWKAIENYDDEMRARLLQFVTGTSKVPMNGFAEMQGSSGPQKFCIKKLGTPNEFPRAHTCFNRIDLPPYQSYHELKEKLKFAIESTEGFAGVD